MSQVLDEAFQLQQVRFNHPEADVADDIHAIYSSTNSPSLGVRRSSRASNSARQHTIAIVGVGLGDEGKGRFVDNQVEELLHNVDTAYVVRYQGGSNAGHTVEKGSLKLALHQVPSGVLYPEVIGIMDRGMVIHTEDLKTEIEMAERSVGDLRKKLFLSQDAILVTDLERAEEVLNRMKQGNAKGGTGRGIGPAYAHFYDRLGLLVRDLVDDHWIETLGSYYERYQKEFTAFNMDIASVSIPDYAETLKKKKAMTRTVGTKQEFLDRLASTRSWIVKRKLIANTFLIHAKEYSNQKRGFLFEGAQSAGLHAWLGTRPDVTASDTSIYGILPGTGYWLPQQIAHRIGVFKITYTSSVGQRRMPTHIDLPSDLHDLPQHISSDVKRAAFIRETAHEYGTTTGRPRDILNLDLPMLTYNCHVSGVDVLAGTHLDLAREDEPIRVCTHYEKNGKLVRYQPGLAYLEGVTPSYIELPGWDGSGTKNVQHVESLPLNAQKFLAFIQRRTGFPIIAVTTGASRDQLITFEGYTQ